MSEMDALIGRLADGLPPVRRLWPPMVRAMSWLGFAVLFAVLITSRATMMGGVQRFATVPDLGWVMAGAVLTAVLAAVAAFELSLPDRHGAWALLPVPGVALWLSASGWGCLRGGAPGLEPATMMDGMGCMGIILGVSLPLSVALLVLVWRARPLRPGLVALMGGVAAAGASLAMLSFHHPHDASAVDLLMHIVAVVVVVVAVRLFGGRALHAA